MKLTANKSALEQAIRLVAPACAGHTTIPAIKNLKAIAIGDSLTLLGYDPTAGISLQYTLAGDAVSITRPGTAVIPREQLTAICRESREDSVAIDASKEAIRVESGGRYSLLAYDPAEFPEPPTGNSGANKFTLLARDLRIALNRVEFAVDKKETTAKFALSGVLFERNSSGVRIVGTDQKRLAVYEIPGAGGEAVAAIVPARAIALLRSALADESDTVDICIGTSDATFRFGPVTIYTALLQGKFPPYRDIITKCGKQAREAITLPVAEFASAVRRAAIMSDEESKRVDIAFTDNAANLSARGANRGAAEVAMPLPGYAGTAKTALDPQYLTEFLRAIEGTATVQAAYAGPDSPVIFTAGTEYTYLISPLAG